MSINSNKIFEGLWPEIYILFMDSLPPRRFIVIEILPERLVRGEIVCDVTASSFANQICVVCWRTD